MPKLEGVIIVEPNGAVVPGTAEYTRSRDCSRTQPTRLARAGFESLSSPPGETHEALITRARSMARKVVLILPPLFDRVMPRGYTIADGMLVMTKFDSCRRAGPVQPEPLYGAHESWGASESAAFLQDLREGWLGELTAFMRWQLRDHPRAFDTFQQTLQSLTNAD